jgi:alpha-tubulin suppressor-like RCC1 family protein
MLKIRFLLVFLSAVLMLAMAPFMESTASAAKFTTVPTAAAGYYHSLVLKSNGTVFAWGNNEYGQLGDGTNAHKNTPVQVAGLSNVAALAGGFYHSLALDKDGAVWAWGYNKFGQLGDGTNAHKNTPIQVAGLPVITAIAAGGDHSLALDDKGTVWAWGKGDYGQLGDGANDSSPTPVKVKGKGGVGNLSDVTALAGGLYHSLALKSDGTVFAWGDNEFGQLGDGTNDSSTTPVKVLGKGGVGNLSDIKVITGEVSHSLALDKDGAVWAWGRGDYGQLGDGINTDRFTPVQVLGKGGVGNLSDVTALAVGLYHSFALESNGMVLTWGFNYLGQMGDGTAAWFPFPKNTTPVQVVGEGGHGNLTDVAVIVAGDVHSLAVKNDGSVWAWGWNDSGQLGDGTNWSVTSVKTTPVRVLGGDTGDDFLNLYSTGPDEPDEPDGPDEPDEPDGPDLTLASLAAGADHSLMLKEDGTVLAWGKNSFGQLGDGTKTTRRISAQVKVKGDDGSLTPLSDVAALAAGSYHSLALKSDGTVWAWGKNNAGQLGDGTKTSRLIPVQVKELYGVVAIAAGCSHSLALDKEGIVWAWGYNKFGQLGDGTKTSRLIPVQVERLSDVTAIAAGGFHSLAVKGMAMVQPDRAIAGNGTVWSWGRNNYGQLGDGTKTKRLTPIPVGLTAKVLIPQPVVNMPVNLPSKIITAGWYHSLVVTDNGVWAWGRNSNGQLGNGTTKGSLTPVYVDLSAKTLAAGAGHSLALNDSDEVRSWGKNNSGQLGDGTTKMRNFPK